MFEEVKVFSMGRWIERIRTIHWAWYILAASFLTTLVSYSIRLGYGVILPEMMRSLGISKTEGGLTYSALLVTYTLFAPIVGNLTDRIGGRKVITFFCVVLALGVLLMGTVNRLVTAVLFLAIVGIGISSTWTPVVALTTRWFSAKKRGFVLGVITLGSFVGYGILGLIYPLILVRYNWRFGWIILGVLALGVAVINGIMLRSKPEDLNLLPYGEKEKSSRPQFHIDPSYREILNKKIFWQIGISYFSIAFCYYTFISFIVTYGTTEIGIRYSIAASFASVLAFGGMVGTLPIATLSDSFGRNRTIIMSQLVITASIMFLLVARSNLWMVFISTAIFGISFGPIFPLYGACSRDYFEGEVTGTVLGAWTFIYGIGGVLAPLITGYLSDLTGTLRWSFALAGIASLISSGMFLGIRKQD
jgi:sugar phosphate permease